jgi:hypothetical protein
MAKIVALLHPQQTSQVLGKLLVLKCGLFREDPMLVASPYTVRSEVSQRDFRTFITALEGSSVPITNDNMGGLTGLCEEFQFGELAEWLSQFRESEDLKEEETLTDVSIARLPTQSSQLTDRELAAKVGDSSKPLSLAGLGAMLE